MNNKKIKTRFCPSPTGSLHLGNIRTALFNALFAQGHNGIFLLRIEDTDQLRSDLCHEEALQADLKWLGLEWDEGPGCERAQGPYRQSERHSIYALYYEKLIQKGLAYPCFCSEETLALTRKLQLSAGKPPRYSGKCRHLSVEEIAKNTGEGLRPTLRFRVNLEKETHFQDLVKGEQVFKHQDIGDFIIRRADGTAPFMYCNALDDALMGVTHALRGEDHLTNTPRQIMLLEALGLPVPTYGHISLIVGADGAPLSKRHGSQSLQRMREEGYLPMAILNYLARLGHHYAEEHWMTFRELCEHFSLEKLGAAPARFDPHQLYYWQKETLNRLSVSELWTWCMKSSVGEKLAEYVPSDQRAFFLETVRPNSAFPREILEWAECFYKEVTVDFWDEEGRAICQAAGKELFHSIHEAVDAWGADFPKIMDHMKSKHSLQGKALFHPLRVLLTGRVYGPNLGQVCALLGPERINERLKVAFTHSVTHS